MHTGVSSKFNNDKYVYDEDSASATAQGNRPLLQVSEVKKSLSNTHRELYENALWHVDRASLLRQKISKFSFRHFLCFLFAGRVGGWAVGVLFVGWLRFCWCFFFILY